MCDNNRFTNILNNIKNFEFDNTGIMIFKFVHNTNIEIYIMWLTIICTIYIILKYCYDYITDYTETFLFIKKL